MRSRRMFCLLLLVFNFFFHFSQWFFFLCEKAVIFLGWMLIIVMFGKILNFDRFTSFTSVWVSVLSACVLYPTSKIGFLIFFFPARSSKKEMLTLSENPRTSFWNHKLKFTLCQKHVLILPSVSNCVLFLFYVKILRCREICQFCVSLPCQKVLLFFRSPKMFRFEKSYRFRFI